MAGRIRAILACVVGLALTASMGVAVAEEEKVGPVPTIPPVFSPNDEAALETVTPGACDRAIQGTTRAYEAGQRVNPRTEQLARDCTTIAYSESVGGVSSDGSFAARSICRSITGGRAYYNAFRTEIVRFQGHLRACGNRSRTTGGDFWMTINRCCHWYYEGVVHQDQGGCFNGCPFVSRYRRGSFVFNPPWPTVTTRMQPWFRLRVNADGTASQSSGD